MAVRKHSQDFKDQCVLEVINGSRPVVVVAREYGLVAQTLRNWVAEYRKSHPVPVDELTVPERARLKALEAEIRELRAQNEFLGKAAAFFAKRFL